MSGLIGRPGGPGYSRSQGVSRTESEKIYTIGAVFQLEGSRAGTAAVLVIREHDALIAGGTDLKLPVIIHRPSVGAIRFGRAIANGAAINGGSGVGAGRAAAAGFRADGASGCGSRGFKGPVCNRVCRSLPSKGNSTQSEEEQFFYISFFGILTLNLKKSSPCGKLSFDALKKTQSEKESNNKEEKTVKKHKSTHT